jgi:hypothetical protein
MTTVAVQDHTHYALSVCVYPADEQRWALRMSFDAARVAPSWVRRLVDDIVAGLRDIAEDPSRPVIPAAVVESWVQAADEDRTAGSDGTQPSTASTQTVTAVASAWKDLLGQEFGPSDDFFKVGGSSVTAMRFAMRLQSVLGVRVPVRAIFEGRTGDAIVRYVETAMARNTN